MFRDMRELIRTCVSRVIGTASFVARPFPAGDELVQVIRFHEPRLFDLVAGPTRPCSTTTPFSVASLLCSVVYIVVRGIVCKRAPAPCPSTHSPPRAADWIPPS